MLVRSILTAPICSYERPILYASCSVHSTCTQLHQNDMVISRGGHPRTAFCMLYRPGIGSRGAGNHGVGRLCKDYMDSLQLEIVGRGACCCHERETDVENSPQIKASLLHIHQRWIRYYKWTQVCSQVQMYSIHSLHTLGAFTRPEENEEGVCALLSG